MKVYMNSKLTCACALHLPELLLPAFPALNFSFCSQTPRGKHHLHIQRFFTHSRHYLQSAVSDCQDGLLKADGCVHIYSVAKLNGLCNIYFWTQSVVVGDGVALVVIFINDDS